MRFDRWFSTPERFSLAREARRIERSGRIDRVEAPRDLGSAAAEAWLDWAETLPLDFPKPTPPELSPERPYDRLLGQARLATRAVWPPGPGRGAVRRRARRRDLRRRAVRHHGAGPGRPGRPAPRGRARPPRGGRPSAGRARAGPARPQRRGARPGPGAAARAAPRRGSGAGRGRRDGRQAAGRARRCDPLRRRPRRLRRPAAQPRARPRRPGGSRGRGLRRPDLPRHSVGRPGLRPTGRRRPSGSSGPPSL